MEREMNNTLMTLAHLTWNYYNDCLKNNKNVRPEAVRDVLLRKDCNYPTLLESFNRHLATLRLE